MKISVSRIVAVTVTSAALTAPLALAGNADARGGGSAVRSTGTCTGGGTFALKAKHDDGRIEVEFEVDTNVAGRAWTVRLTDDGAAVFSGSATTTAPSGSFTVRRLIADRAGADTIRATAVRGTRTCRGTVTV